MRMHSVTGTAFLFLASSFGGGLPASGLEPDLASLSLIPTAKDVILPKTELVLLAPGTQVDRTLPTGWSHLVIKSVPRLASGDIESLPGMATTTATLFRTVLLADVRPAGDGPDRQFTLRRVGLGLCVQVKGHDTVVMADTLSAQGVDLGIVARTVLDRAEQEIQRGRIVTRTPTFALFSAPTTMRVGTVHREALLRYAFLVDPETGSLQTLVWAIAPEPTRRAAAQRMVLLTPSLVYDCGLDVAADRLFGAVPVRWSFAMRGLPAGQGLPVPPELQSWSIREARTPLEASQFETALRLSLTETPRHAAR